MTDREIPQGCPWCTNLTLQKARDVCSAEKCSFRSSDHVVRGVSSEDRLVYKEPTAGKMKTSLGGRPKVGNIIDSREAEAQQASTNVQPARLPNGRLNPNGGLGQDGPR